MTSFLEKLKKGMGIELKEEEESSPTESHISKKSANTEDKKVKKTGKKVKIPKTAKEKHTKIKTEKIELPEIKIESDSDEEETEEKSPREEFTSEENPIEQEETKKISLTEYKSAMEKSETEKQTDRKKWIKKPEGQLTVDVYQTDSHLIIQSAIGGVKPEELDINLEDDRIIIRGDRQNPIKESGDYFTKECYFGPFLREIILPVEVNLHGIEADMKEGLLTIKIPKITKERIKKIVVKKGG